MKNLHLLLILLVSSIGLTSCFKYVPTATTRSTSHNGSVWVTPGWHTKRNIWGHGWPYFIGATAGVSLGANQPFTQKRNGITDTLSRGGSMMAGAFVGTLLLGLPLEGAKRKKNNLPKRAFNESDTEQWVKAYKGDWVLVDRQSPNLKIVPRKQHAAYIAEEKAIAEREERAKRLAEEEALKRREVIDYQAIRKGSPENLNEYLKTYPNGAHRTEVERLVPTYSLYRQAVNGQLKDIKAYLSNAGAFFEKDRLQALVPLLEAYEANATKRQAAINAHFGIGQRINSTQCRAGLEALVKDKDDMARYWKGHFLNVGGGSYQMDEVLGKIMAEQTLHSRTFQASLKYPETIFASALHMLMHSEKAETRADAGIVMESMARNSTYLPALYYQGVFQYARNNYDEAEKILLKAYQLDLKRAATALGTLYSNRKYSGYNLTKAIEWLTLGSDHGDEEAALKLANLYYGGEDVRPDLSAALKWATKAEKMGSTAALVFLGKLYLNEHQNQPSDYKKALQYLRRAADANDREGMFILGLLSYEGRIPGFKDDKQALFLLKKAAEAGQPQSMALMGKIYNEGKLTASSTIKSRYWLGKARQAGVGQGAYQPQVDSPMASILKRGDFSTTYTVTREYYSGREISRTPNTASDFIGGLIDGAFKTWWDRETNTQQVINGLELIYEKEGVAVYGGTITSAFSTNLELRYGQYLTFKSSGVVSAGAFAGDSGPEGINGYQSYNLVPNFRHMAIIGRIDIGINIDSWFLLGRETQMRVPAGGKLILAVNDKDYRNNQGYFDMEIIIEDNTL